MKEHTVYLALGSNLGDRLANLKQAIDSLTPQMEVRAKSSVYETPPWGYADQPKFLNQVVKAKTYLDPEPLLKHLKTEEELNDFIRKHLFERAYDYLQAETIINVEG